MAVAQINVGFQVQVKELADKLAEASKALDNYKDKFREAGNSIGKAGVYIGRYVDQMAGTVISSIGGVVAFIPELVQVFSKLTAFLAANPWILVATAIGAAGAALYAYTRAGNEAAKTQRMLNNINKEAISNTAKERAELDSLIKIAKDETLMKKDRLDAIKKLNDISPEFLGNIDLETINTKEATDAIKKYVAALNSKSREQAIAAKKTELYQKQIEIESKSVGEDDFFQGTYDKVWEMLGFTDSTPIIRSREELEEFIKTQKEEGKSVEYLRAVYEPYLQIREKQISKIQDQIDILDDFAAAERAKAEDSRDISNNTIKAYEAEIASLQKLQKEAAKTPEQFKAYQDQIGLYKKKIAEIDGGKTSGRSSKKELEQINIDTIAFYESQISGLRKYQEKEATTADQFADTADKIAIIQAKIDAIINKREKAVSISLNIDPIQEGTLKSYEKQIKYLEEMRDRLPIASLGWQNLNNQIRDIEFEIKAKIDEGSFSMAQESMRNLQDSIEGQKKVSQELLAQSQEEAILYGEAVGGAFDTLSQNFISSMGETEDGLSRFGQVMAQTVLKLIAMALSNAMANSIVGATQSGNATGPAAVFTTPAFIATALAGILGAFASIPQFADGGLVYGTTLGIMGEYAGANRNPEVIAPLDKLRDIIEPAGGGVTQIVLGGGFKISGRELELVLDRNTTRSKRIR